MSGDERDGSDLEHSRRQVAGDEGGGHGSVPPLQEVDGVEEEQVTRDHQEDKDSGWFGVDIWRKRLEKNLHFTTLA